MSLGFKFEEFPKIPRYRREVAITEKIDGTNAAIRWVPYDNWPEVSRQLVLRAATLFDSHGVDLGLHGLIVQSRKRFITPDSDNFGFAQWALTHIDELKKLGPGTHYGEWWGSGIQRGYGLPPGEKRFSLFNVARWGNASRPACCSVVPLLGYFTPERIESVVRMLRANGSYAERGYMDPEGIVIWHSQSRQYYKILLENDELPKSLSHVEAAYENLGT
jgi:hypothetical protein